MLKQNVVPIIPANWKEKASLPLWAPSIAHKIPSEASCKQVYQKKLREVGIIKLCDILDPNGGFRSWAHFETNLCLARCERAYTNLCGNIFLESYRVIKDNNTQTIFVHVAPLREGNKI